MPTPKHTPGPWVSGEYSSGTEVTGRNGKTICFLAVSRSDQSPAADTSRANATLIAAAPAMYEALLSILPATDIVSGQETDNCRWCGRDYTDHAVETGETLELCSSDDCHGYIARAALAQAEGR